MKIHHVLLIDHIGQSVMETLCNRIVYPQRDEAQTIIGFRTERGNTIQCDVYNGRSVTCNTCQHVWRNIKGKVD